MTQRGETPAHEGEQLYQHPAEGKRRGVERGSRGRHSARRRLPFPVGVGLMLLALSVLFLAGW